MEENRFKSVEDRLYGYYRDIREIDGLKKQNDYLSEKLDEIEGILKRNDFDYDISLGSLTYEEKVQTSSSGESVIEKHIMRQAEKYLKYQEAIVYDILDNDLRIKNKELSIAKMDVAIELLDEEEKDFIKLRYDEKLLIENIAVRLNMTDRNIYYIKKRLLMKLSNYFKEAECVSSRH